MVTAHYDKLVQSDANLEEEAFSQSMNNLPSNPVQFSQNFR